jgi:hypothetical protein
MEHGRDHDNRSFHIRSPRHNNTPDDPESEPGFVEEPEPPPPTDELEAPAGKSG